jgi:putative heme-binding domain-containing protein
VFRRDKPSSFRPNADQFDAQLTAGSNRLVIKVRSDSPSPKFHVRFRAKSSRAEHERLARLILEGRGNLERGREVFANVEKSQCMKCHRIGENGGRIGPDLTGIGSRFSRIHLIESILEPSRSIAPSFATVTMVLDDGKVFSGVKTAENAETIQFGDADGKTHSIARSEIEEMKVSNLSTMPEGLEKRLTDRELIDLLAFLTSLRNRPLDDSTLAK